MPAFFCAIILYDYNLGDGVLGVKKPRLAAIEYIRGISMLGVVGIHVGSQYLSNPAANMHLVALFEVVTRFSVPIFFFISAFGMFYNLDLTQPFNYKSFLKRRISTVVIPYVVWSLFYLVHYAVLWGDTSVLSPFYMLFSMFFGTAGYQLYFMVILLWFYLMMPVWVWMVQRLNMLWLAGLLAFQIVFDYWSCFVLNSAGVENFLLRSLIDYRLNYWVLHYIFIFVLGGYLAVHISWFKELMKHYRSSLTAFFWLSLAGLLGYYYWLIFSRGYTPLEGINTAQQLCPAGIIYTLGASLFFFAVFTEWRMPEWLKPVFAALGRHSYFVYLAHPVAITYLGIALAEKGQIMTAPAALCFFAAVVVITLGAAAAMRRLGEKIPLINELSIGVYKKK